MHAIRPLWVRSLAPAALALTAVALVSAQLGAFPVPYPDAPLTAPVESASAVAAETIGVAGSSQDDAPPAVAEDDDTLELELVITESNAACAYYSVWDDDGIVAVAAELTEAEFERPFDFLDGCHWRSHERLVKVAPGRFRYTYTEAPEQCRRGAHAAAACTRSGFAVVVTDEE